MEPSYKNILSSSPSLNNSAVVEKKKIRKRECEHPRCLQLTRSTFCQSPYPSEHHWPLLKASCKGQDSHAIYPGDWIPESQQGWGWQRPLGPAGPAPAQGGTPRAGCPGFWRSPRRLHSGKRDCTPEQMCPAPVLSLNLSFAQSFEEDSTGRG